MQHMAYDAVPSLAHLWLVVNMQRLLSAVIGKYMMLSSAVQSDFASKATQLETHLLPLHADTVDSASAGLHAVLHIL